MMQQRNLQPQSQQQGGQEMDRKQWPQRVILQQHPGEAAQQAGVFYLQEVDGGERVNHFQGEKSRLLGKFHIGFGCICVLLNSITLSLNKHSYFFLNGNFPGVGIWNGFLFITSGILCMIAGTIRTKCLIIACLVMCIISAVSTLILFPFGIIEAVDSHGDRLFLLLNCLLIFMALPEAIVAIFASRICCSVMCQCFGSHNTYEIVFIPQPCDPAHHMSDVNFVQVTSQQTQPSGVEPNSSMSNPCSLGAPYRPPTSSTDDASAPLPHNSVFYQTKPDVQDDQLLTVTPEEPDDDDTLLLC